MKIETDPESPTVASKPYPLPLKHNNLVKEEIENLLEAGLIEYSMSPYATPVIVVPWKSKPGAPLVETQCLAINYRELNKITKSINDPNKAKSSLALIETAKIDHMWSKLWGSKVLYDMYH